MHKLKSLNKRIGGAIHMFLSKKKGQIHDIRFRRSKGAYDVADRSEAKGN